ncbi:MAG: hypothetical protein RLZZ134_710 [Pseudomonadota bacterium]|jgi:cytochrome b
MRPAQSGTVTGYKEFEMNLSTAPLRNTLQSTPKPSRKTVDAFTRTLHALMALCFTGAFITAESEVFRLVHLSLGYTMGGLFVVRLLWGGLGPRQVRWSALWGKLSGLQSWVESFKLGQVAWRQGQNLFLSLTVVALLLAMAPVVLSGVVTEQGWTGDWMAEIHEFFGNFMLLAVLAHLAGVILFSALRRRNMAKPMLTGRIEGAGPDLIKSNHAGLAVLLLAAVLSFWVWQWQTSPQGQSGAGFGASLGTGVATFLKAQSDDD